MTSTNESNAGIAGVSVVLQSALTLVREASRSRSVPQGREDSLTRSPTDAKSTPLVEWLSEWEHTPAWIPRRQRDGAFRIMAALPQSKYYPILMQRLVEQISQKTTVEWQGKSYDLTGVEVDSHDLQVLRIPIFSAQPLRANLGRAIHALCFRWLAAADSALAERLHQQNHLPITLAIQPSSRQPTYLRIGLLQKELLSPLLWGISQDLGGEITLTDQDLRKFLARTPSVGAHSCAPLLDVDSLRKSGDISCRLGKWVEIQHTSSFEALSQIPPSNVIELQFLSPTSFKQSQRIQPFPLPELVFGSLLRRWNAFAPAALQFPILEWQGLTCAYELKTQALYLKGGTEIGTTGWVRYEFPNSFLAKTATTLAHFARFAGVGRKTGMGMGQVRIR